MSFLSQPISFFPTNSRTIADIPVQVVIHEDTSDVLTITKQPVQQGAPITDHAFKEPTILRMSIYFRDNIEESLSEIYADLLELQDSREPVTVSTPKRLYSNMLFQSIAQVTDKATENCLQLNLTMQEIILVPIVTVTVPRLRQKNAGATGATQNAGKKSALLSLTQGIKSLTGSP